MHHEKDIYIYIYDNGCEHLLSIYESMLSIYESMLISSYCGATDRWEYYIWLFVWFCMT
jgi:hypothetical protein